MKLKFILFFLAFTLMSKAQVANAPCNDYSGWTSPKYTMTVESEKNLITDKWSNKGNLIDNTTSSVATWSTMIGGSAWIEARNASNTQFPAGSYAGFVVSDFDLVSIGGNMKIITYNGSTMQETVTFNDLVGTILDGGKRKIGFVTTKPFNRIRLDVNSGLTLIFTANAYYAEVVKPCAGTALACNTMTALVRTNFGAIIEPKRTGLRGVSLGLVSNVNNATNEDPTDFATLSVNAGIFGSADLSVRNLGETFAAGTFAGFDVENVNIISLSALSNVTIKTYLNGVLQERKEGTDVFLSLPLLDFENRTVLGFETTKSFNEIQIEINQPLGVSLGVTKVFSAVVKKPCEGTALVCNTPTAMIEPNYPVNINTVRTGITGIASALSRINEPDNVLDANTNNYATISVPVTAGTIASLSVKKSLSDFPAGTYAGFDIQNVSLLNAQFLQNITLRTFNNGVLQETVSGNGILLGAGTDLLASDGRAVTGFVTTKAFDELQISINSILGVDVGNTRVYKMVVAKQCATTIDCNSSYYITQPKFPVVLNAQRTGIKTLGCVACSVNNPDNIIDSNPSNFSRITLAAGVLNSGSISAMVPGATFPAGTYAGFTVKDRYFLVQGDLFEFITIKTYYNGTLQESKTSFDLIDLSLIIPIWGTGTKNVGFNTTKPFNEVQIETKSLGSIINILDVYGALIDTRSSTGGTGGLNCTPTVVANDDTQTIVPGNAGTVSVLTNDTYNGVAATLTNVNITQGTTTNPGVTINPTTGLVNVAAGTPVGTYTVDYTICSKTIPPVCDPARVTVTVASSIKANQDTQTITAGSQGTVSVLNNDTLNGAGATLSNVNLTQVSTQNAGVNLNPATGLVTVATGTPAGNYNVDYQICDKANPGVCSTSTVVVTVPQPAVQPDLSVKISANAPVIVLGNDTTIFFTIKNESTVPTNGSPIVLTVTKSTGAGDLSPLTTLPSGWSITSQTATTMTLTYTGTPIAAGATQVIPLNFYLETLLQFVSFNGKITDGSGGDSNPSNNSDNVLLVVTII